MLSLTSALCGLGLIALAAPFGIIWCAIMVLVRNLGILGWMARRPSGTQSVRRFRSLVGCFVLPTSLMMAGALAGSVLLDRSAIGQDLPPIVDGGGFGRGQRRWRVVSIRDLVPRPARRLFAVLRVPGHGAMKIGYLVHDLADDAVHRRVRMLHSCADTALLGFHRTAQPGAVCPGHTTVNLGRTMDARLVRGPTAVLRAAAGVHRWEECLRVALFIVARQLEMLALAALARNRIAPDAALVFECLDIHRLMLTRQPIGAALRTLERHLLASCSLLIVSSPAFIANHFAQYGTALPPQLLLENKVLADDLLQTFWTTCRRFGSDVRPDRHGGSAGWSDPLPAQPANPHKPRPRLPNLVHVVIRGRPRRNVIPDFDAMVSGTPGVSFLGEYDRHADLAAIYRDVHFAWAMDFYEADANSEWLLPNRLYEGSLHGAVPLACASVETGRWLAAQNCGVLLRP